MPETGHVLILAGAVVSAIANVLTSRVLKGDPKATIHLQNTQLYLYGVVFNLLSVWIQPKVRARARVCLVVGLWLLALDLSVRS